MAFESPREFGPSGEQCVLALAASLAQGCCVLRIVAVELRNVTLVADPSKWKCVPLGQISTCPRTSDTFAPAHQRNSRSSPRPPMSATRMQPLEISHDRPECNPNATPGSRANASECNVTATRVLVACAAT